MVVQQNTAEIPVYYQLSTSNQSFLDMHYYLRERGVKNNKFFLVLYDSDLEGVDPRDPRLNSLMKRKVLRECIVNFWYFIREVVRIPDQGGTVGGGKRYKLHRGNLALNFGFLMNWNMFLELPRQHGKTISAICWYLWVFNFGTTNSEMMFMNKKHDDSKMNLRRMKDIRDALPSYLQMSEIRGENGKTLKASNNVETMTHISNHNKVTTKPGAKSKTLANSLGRGCTMPVHWYDEYAFIVYNSIIYASATPAYKTAANNAKANGAPFGILITTTPGDTTTDEGEDARMTKDTATPFSEMYYDMSLQQLQELQNTNTESSFFYMRFTYQQLGSGEDYFKEMVRDLKKNWAAIRREVLLEWAKSSDNSPFKQQDLDEVSHLIMKEPINQILVCNYYTVNIYKTIENNRFPPIIGVDVSGGYQKDSSTFTIIDSRTTETIADFNCNYISTGDLAKVLYEIVTKFMPSAIVNVERNGGFGASVLAPLIKSKIKRNLYYEIKDRVIEERFDGMNTVKKTKKVKVYGLDETKDTRDKLMEILRDRMENHKGKFISPIIYNELTTLEVKKNGRIEHSSNAHDDQIFSYLLALYVWYEGQNLMERFGLEKGTITTDEDTESDFGIYEEYEDITEEINSSENELVQSQLEYLNSDKSVSYESWLETERETDEASMKSILNTKIGRKAYAAKYHIAEDDIPSSTFYVIPDSVFRDMYDGESKKESDLLTQFRNITDVR